MELNTILTLINAGYTKAEIDSMTGAGQQTEQGAGQQNGQSAGQQTEQGAAGQQNEQGAEKSKETENISELTKQIMALSEVVKGLQTQNAKRAESAPPEKMGADGAIKGFFGVK